MTRFVGVWIDGSKARIVEFDQEGRCKTRRFAARKPMRFPGPMEDVDTAPRTKEPILRAGSAHGKSIEDDLLRRVVSSLTGADRIAIFGPDHVKNRLDHEIRSRPKLLRRLIGVERMRFTSEGDFIHFLRGFYGFPNGAANEMNSRELIA